MKHSSREFNERGVKGRERGIVWDSCTASSPEEDQGADKLMFYLETMSGAAEHTWSIYMLLYGF